MDFNLLVNEITARVLEKIDGEEVESFGGAVKSKLLILTQQHGEACHKLYESKALSSCYQVDCAQLIEGEAELADYEGVILFGLTNDALAGITCGHVADSYSRLVIRSLLLGKKIYIPNQEVELFNYRNTSPRIFYKMMESKLTLLADSGVVFCDLENLEQVICGRATAAAKGEPSIRTDQTPWKEITLSKRVVTEKDVIQASKEHVKTICIGTRSIITDLAKDYARDRGVDIIRG